LLECFGFDRREGACGPEAVVLLLDLGEILLVDLPFGYGDAPPLQLGVGFENLPRILLNVAAREVQVT
jgi:hypothetical protein